MSLTDAMISQANPAGRPRVSIDVDGIRVRALVDTGASHSLISSRLYHKLPKIAPLGTGPTLYGLGRQRLDVEGSTFVSVGGMTQQVIVLPRLDFDLLLGIDFLRPCVIDGPQKLLVVGTKKYNLMYNNEPFQEVGATSTLPEAHLPCLKEILESYRDIFCDKQTPVKVAPHLTPAHIEVDCKPIRQKPYRLPFQKRETVESAVQEMQKEGIIRPSDSPWASPIVLVGKKDGSTRFCVDYRKLNAHTKKDAHPLPHIQDVFDQLKGAKIFSTLDLKSGYWQVPMEPQSIPKTAFTCHLGLFEFVRMPFGLTNAPAIFQRAMTKALSGLIGKICMVYIDDIVVYSSDPKEHAQHLSQVFDRLRQHGLQLKPSKCCIGMEKLELLGYIISGEGIQTQPEKVAAIQNLAPPTTVKQVQSFMGMVNYYKSFIPNLAEIAFPLTTLTKKSVRFTWNHEHQQAFDALKTALVQAPILAHPDPSKPYILYTDASDLAVGGILVQDHEGQEKVIAYLSHKLTGSASSWPAIEKEAYAILYSLKKFHCYLYGAKFEIHTDHKPLRSLFQDEQRNSKLQRWAIQISEYGAPIMYHPGKLNIRADMLSRIACVTSSPQTNHLETPKVIPTAWGTDGIDDLEELVRHQIEQFPGEREEAEADIDGSPYLVQDSILYTMSPPFKGAGVLPRAVLPQQYRQQVIDRCHQDTGHSGFPKTLLKIQEFYVWPGMRKHVKQYLENCQVCTRVAPKPEAQPRTIIPTPPRPFHTWGIDLVGPFPRDKKGRQYLMTCIDHHTGWAEAVPLRSKGSVGVQDAFMEHIVSRYGTPSVLISDNGGEFNSTPFKKWLAHAGIEHHLTSPHHPQSNGKCERFNGTLQNLIKRLSGANPRKWSEYLPDALLAYRNNPSAAGPTPYECLFGQRPRLPRAPSHPELPGERLRNVHRAREMLIKQQNRRKEKYKAGEPKNPREYVPGDMVSVRVLSPKKGETPWCPGYEVLRCFQGALLLRAPDGHEVRINQERVRLLPPELPYELVDPLPNKKDLPKVRIPEQVPLTDLAPPSEPLIARAAPSTTEWNDWCSYVTYVCSA